MGKCVIMTSASMGSVHGEVTSASMGSVHE